MKHANDLNCRNLLHRMIFTSSGDLDLGWVLLALAFVNGILFFDLAALGHARVSVAAWSWYGSLTGLSFIAGATISRARLIADSRMVGDVASAIATAAPEQPFQPHEWASGDPHEGVA